VSSEQAPFEFIERNNCPACASTGRVTLINRPFDDKVVRPLVERYCPSTETLSGGRFHVVECAECLTIYHAETGGEELLSALYGEWLKDSDQSDKAVTEWLAAHPRHSRDGHEIITVGAVLRKPISALKTLDFGMGAGLWARVSKGIGCDSYGSDLSESCMSVARARGVKTITTADIPGQMFDFINTEQVMEHITDTSIVSTLALGLRPGGILKISVPAQGSVRDSILQLDAGKAVTPEQLVPAFPLEHVNTFTGEGLRRLGSRYGLRKFRPSIFQRAAFVPNPRNWLFGKVRNTMKELARPFVRYENKTNLAVWLRLPG
jgi:hypothetical protein